MARASTCRGSRGPVDEHEHFVPTLLDRAPAQGRVGARMHDLQGRVGQPVAWMHDLFILKFDSRVNKVTPDLVHV